ncbi:hypothetical protein ABIB35_001844 [Arthrobacter sp. UYP6]
MLVSMPTSPVSIASKRQPSTPDHEHSWLTESRHQVSDGVILYVRCSQCTARRVDLKPYAQLVPAGISNLVQP